MVAGGLIALAVAVGLGSVAALALSDSGTQGGRQAATQSKKMDVFVSEFGVRVGMQTTFDEAVTLSSPALRAGALHDKASLWPEDDKDHEGEDLDPLKLAAGTPVLVEGQLRPDCDGSDPGTNIVFSVQVRRAGGPVATSQFSASHTQFLRNATKTWCALGPRVRVHRSSIAPNGAAIVHLVLTNPGPDTISVEIPAYADKQVSWSPASASVPEGEDVDVVVRGANIQCQRGEKGSWLEGRMRIDGKPFVVSSDDGWC